ncbi:MAG: complex I subunit 5 family protein [Pseudomonadota bacterium]
MTALALLALLLPLALIPGLLAPASRPMAQRVAPWAPLPALALATADDFSFDLPGVLVGVTLGLDASGRLFLAFTALVWLIAGSFAHGWLRDDPRPARFWVFWLATLAGNLGVCLALDAVSFYFFFALMSFAAYGLVVHAGSEAALRAGRVYLGMAVLGETALVMGLLLAVRAADAHTFAALAAAPASEAAVWLLIVGFGIKLGVPLLHMWLPLAHPVAPVPASAVLSGVMLKAGLLGWLRCLPLGTQALPDAGLVLMLAGLAAMFLGVVAGLMQRNLKVLLAYSSVSQMGYLSFGVGAGLLAPTAWPLLLPALGLYALHHALAKSALFLGAGLIRVRGVTPLRLALLALPALALAGAPLSSGALAKTGLTLALAGLPAPWPMLADNLLPLAALGTALLMARFLWLAWQTPAPTMPTATRGLHAPWLLGVLASVLLVWVWAPEAVRTHAVMTGALASAGWPLALALVLAAAAMRLRVAAPALPPGDLLEWLTRALARCRAHQPAGAVLRPAPVVRAGAGIWPRITGRPARSVRIGLLWLGVLMSLLALLAR